MEKELNEMTKEEFIKKCVVDRLSYGSPYDVDFNHYNQGFIFNIKTFHKIMGKPIPSWIRDHVSVLDDLREALKIATRKKINDITDMDR